SRHGGASREQSAVGSRQSTAASITLAVSRPLRGFPQPQLSVHPIIPTSLPAVTLKPRRAMPFHNRHPWVFAGAILRAPGDLTPGAEVRLLADDGEFIARGLFNPHSNIRVRLYGWK